MWRFYSTVLLWILFNNGAGSLDLRTIRNLAYFADRDSSALMQRIVVYNKTREVFVAARNAIYQFDQDLSLKGKTSTGPELDHIKCLHPTFPCDQNGVQTDNDNKVLLVYHSPTADLLLACGTLYQGMCRAIPVENINLFQWIGAFNDSKNFIAGRGSTVAFLAPGSRHGLSLYSASTYDDRPLAYSPVSVSSKVPVWSENNNFTFLYSFESEFSHTGVNFDSAFKRTYKVEYIYGFSYAGFSYFVTTQRVAVDSEAMETRLVRVCQNDLQFFSYTEVPLKCQRGIEDVFNLATAAYLGPASTQLKRKLKISGKVDEILYISFGKTLLDHGSLLDKTRGSVICSFPMDQIITSITNATKECFSTEPRTYLLYHVIGVERKCEKHMEIEVNDDFCGSSFNHFIEGRGAIPGGYRFSVDRHLTSLAVTLQYGKTVAVMGTDQGEVIKETLDKRSAQPLYILNIGKDSDGNNHSIESSNAFDSTHQHIYFLTGNKVVKFPIGSCSVYKDCGSCLSTEDPLSCGWCGDYCAHPDECEAFERMSKNSCPPIIFSVEPLYGPTDGGTEITITGDNFGSSEGGESNSNIAVKVAGVHCDIIQWEKELLKCRTSHVVAESSGPVMVHVVDTAWVFGQFDMNGTAHSLTNFSYVVPKLYGIYPSYGPMSGGTNVTLYGQNLDAGSSHIITTAKQICVNYSVSKNASWCLTRGLPKDSTETAGPVEIIIDEAVVEPEASSDLMVKGITLGKDFHYLPDPDIFKINPQNALVCGIINLTVTGVNLNSVADPKLIVIVTSSLTGETYEKQKPCTLSDSSGFEMVCPTPFIDIPRLGLHAPTDRAPLVAHLAFQMDGVKRLRDLPVHSPSLSQLLYYPNPVFHDPVQTKNNDTHLEIKGSYLNLALTPRDVKVVFDDNQLCNVTSIMKDSLFCSLPSTRSSAYGSEHSIQVIIGHLKYDLGFVRLTNEEVTNYRWFFLFIPLICLFVLLVVYYKKRQASKHGIAFSVSYFANRDEAGNRRRQQINDYQDLNGHRLVQRPSVSPSETACSISAEAQVDENYDISDETLHFMKTEKILVDRNFLSLGEVLGEGYFGRVYKGELLLPGKEERLTVAVKTIHNGASRVEQDKEAFLQEGLMMKDFHHHNVLTLIGVSFENNGSPMFIIPYMKYGDLFSFIRDENQNPTIKDFLTFGVDIAAGMKYLAGLKFVHRDLAARNCMLAEDYTVKVADFGLSRDIYERDYYSSDNKKKLPIKWMAPESLEKGTYSTKSDVWSYGVVLWELLTRGVLPYPGVDNWDLLHYLKNGRRMPQPSYCPDLLYQLMLRCWDFDPKKRPTFDELEEEVRGIITKLELPKRRVSLNVTYVNYPQTVAEASTSRTDDHNT